MISMLFNFRSWLPEVFANRNFLNRDIIAGITLATILIPQSMAYAMLAGVEPKYGLYAAFIPVAIASFFGSSRYLATGPVAMVSLLTAVAAGSLAGGEANLYIFYAILLAFSVGFFQIILSLTKAGKLFDKIPRHVIIGFTSAAALIIGASQFHKIIGFPKMIRNQVMASWPMVMEISVRNPIPIPLTMTTRRSASRVPVATCRTAVATALSHSRAASVTSGPGSSLRGGVWPS